VSVLECDRRGCEHIMCDRLSDTHGYICWQCYDELINLGTLDIAGFMDSAKAVVDDREAAEQYIESVFKLTKEKEGCAYCGTFHCECG